MAAPSISTHRNPIKFNSSATPPMSPGISSADRAIPVPPSLLHIARSLTARVGHWLSSSQRTSRKKYPLREGEGISPAEVIQWRQASYALHRRDVIYCNGAPFASSGKLFNRVEQKVHFEYRQAGRISGCRS